jgi:hypothetical protein
MNRQERTYKNKGTDDNNPPVHQEKDTKNPKLKLYGKQVNTVKVVNLILHKIYGIDTVPE